MRRRLLWSSLLLLPVVLVGAAGLAVLEVRDRLPELLSWLVAEIEPEIELEVGSARLESTERLVAEDVVLSFREAAQPFFRTGRLELEFDWRQLLELRARALRLRAPEVTWAATTAGALSPGGGEGSGWAIDHVSASSGRALIALPPDAPEVAFDFELDLDDVGLGREASEATRRLAVTAVRVGPAERPVFTSPQVEATLSIAELGRGQVQTLHVARPEIDLPASLFEDEAGPTTDDPPIALAVGHLVVDPGRVRVEAGPGRPEVRASFALDLRDVGTAPTVADNTQRIDLTDVRLTLPGPDRLPMLSLPRATAEVSTTGILDSKRLGAVRVPEGSMLLDAAARRFLLASESATGDDGADAWRIGSLEVGTLAVHLAELGPPLPDVTFDVHTTLTELPLSAAAAAIADETQTIELASLALYSPFDPFKKVVTVGSVFVDFSLGGLMQQKIAHVKFLRPTIYLAEDLFWYMTNERGPEGAAPPTPWTIDRLEAELGSLILEIGRIQRVGLPITFHTEARDVRLDNLADLKLAAELEVPEESYSFPDYDLSLDRVHGGLHFEYPPGKGSENFVSTLYADLLAWRDYQLTEGWLSLTFDPRGINGTFGGAGYAGYVNGGITVPYAWSEPWVGWISASEVDLAELTAVAAGGAVEMTGPLDASIALTIANQSLEKATGDLTLARPGRLEITRLDGSQIPADWASWKRDLGEIALATLRDFDYDDGSGKLRFENGVGLATLELTGPAGTRNLEVRYHGEGSDPLSLDVRAASREDGR